MTAAVHLNAAARALDSLPEAEAVAFDAHLADCETCTVEYGEFLATAAVLGSAAAETPPEGLREKVMRAVARTPQLPPLIDGSKILPAAPAPARDVGADDSGPLFAAGRHRRTVRWWRRPVPLVAAAVAAAIIAGGVVVATRLSGPTSQQAAAQCVAAAPDARVQHPSVGSGGSVTVARSCDAAVVQVASMPQLPPGRAYQLWVMAGSAARSAGMVANVENSARRIVVTGIAASDTDIGISVEPSRGSKAPTTAPVWVVPLTS